MTSLQEQSEKRKERLKLIRESANSSNKRPASEIEDPVLRFRAYKPETQELKQFEAEEPTIGPAANINGDTVEVRAEKIKLEVQEEEKTQTSELDLSSLAPKKPNWDLKRDLDNKLKKLNVMTQLAISELIRERLKASGDISLAATLPEPMLE